jgi:hypothetical protein
MIATVSVKAPLFFSKAKTVGSIKDFLEKRPVKQTSEAMTAGALTGVLLATLSKPEFVYASGVADKIVRAFDPIIQVIQGLSYPVGFIMICSGFLVIMTGNRQKGLNIIKWAAIGYIGMQFAPAIMSMLIEVGKAMGR